MRELVFFLEERSTQAMLEGLLPRIVSDDKKIPFRYIVFEGKQDLERQLAKKIQGYRNKQANFFIIRDQDSGDCRKIKEGLNNICVNAGCPNVIIRIICRELESFYLADLAAVETGLEIHGIARHQRKKKFRSPDQLGSPSAELNTLTKGQYQKISGSRAIGCHLDINNDRSQSFKVLVETVRRIAG